MQMLKKLFKKNNVQNIEPILEEKKESIQNINGMKVEWVRNILKNAYALNTYKVHRESVGYLDEKYYIEEHGLCISVVESKLSLSQNSCGVTISIQESGLEELVVCQERGWYPNNTICNWIHQGSWVELTTKTLKDIEQKNNLALEEERVRKEKELQQRLERYDKKYRLPSIFK